MPDAGRAKLKFGKASGLKVGGGGQRYWRRRTRHAGPPHRRLQLFRPSCLIQLIAARVHFTCLQVINTGTAIQVGRGIQVAVCLDYDSRGTAWLNCTCGTSRALAAWYISAHLVRNRPALGLPALRFCACPQIEWDKLEGTEASVPVTGELAHVLCCC